MTPEPKILAMNEMRIFFTRPNKELSRNAIEKITIIYNLPFGLPLTSGKGFVKISLTEKIKVELEVKQKPKINPSKDEKIQTPKIEGSNSMRLWGDRFGRLNYTSAKFTIDTKPIIISHIRSDDFQKFTNYLKSDEYFKKTIIAVNRILDGIRMVSEDYLPRNFIRKDIDACQFEYLDKNCDLVHGFSSFIVGAEENQKSMSNKLLNDKQLKQFQNIIENNIQMPLDLELRLNAKDYLLFENFRMACIEIQSAVEYVISYTIRNFLENENMTDEEITCILKNRLQELKPYLKQATVTDIFEKTEYVKWHNDCYSIRNHVIHKGKNPTYQEANSAIVSGESFIEFLKKFA